jgi:predicted ATPase
MPPGRKPSQPRRTGAPFLHRVESRPEKFDRTRFPFNLPAFSQELDLEFRTPVTLFVGENGSGKSTLLEALAIASRAITVGSAEAADDTSLEGVSSLARAMRLSWTRRSHRGFFLRAEDFFGFARRMAGLRQDLEQGLRDVDEVHAGASEYAKDLARSPYLKELGALRASYGGDLDDRSHGEGFLDLFRARFVPGGLYLLDEPEAPLSPLRQLAFLSMLFEVVREQRAQCIIATHSPILMAFPDATILSFDREPIAPVRYEDLDHVTITRDFLNDPASYLRRL